MKREEYAIRNSISGKEIAEFIGNNDMNRESFARMMNVSKKTVDYWVKKDTIEGPIVFLLTILKRYPELIEYYHIEKAKFPLRLYYMNGDDISTIIDVQSKQIVLKNILCCIALSIASILINLH